jgi:metallophosphoesterase (TIGR00282 family)
MNILFIGDIVGSVGRQALTAVLPRLKRKYDPTFIIANGENAANGKGITGAIAKGIFDLGVHAISMGNHTWDNKDIFEFIDREARIVRPANYPPGTPGRGVTTIKSQGKQLTLINLQGRTFLPSIDCPFRQVNAILAELPNQSSPIFVDFHAEATSEKIAMGWYLDGKVAAVVGTHTHVQSHDQRILPRGTAYVTDVGMVGPRDGVLGMEKDAVLRKFLTQMPVRFEVDKGKWHFHGVNVQWDEKSGTSRNIELIRMEEDETILE